MRIAIPAEVKNQEKRVALTPDACRALVTAGHEVSVQAGAGVGAGFPDADYREAGTNIEADVATLYENAELVVKVKEPQPEEWPRLNKNHLLFCYLHLAAEPKLADALKNIGLTTVAFETVTEADGTTPLLAPMSAVAGRLAVQLGTRFLHSPLGGRGQLLGGIQGMQTGHAVVIGAGVSGREAAHLAYNMGAKVTLLDINESRLEEMQVRYPDMICVKSTPEAISEILPTADLLVGAVYVLGKKAPHVVTEEQIKLMPEGSVAVDISIDQGGCIETSKPCTHDSPSFVKHGVIHSAITNLPGAVPLASSQALSQAILPEVLKLANGNWTPALKEGINVQDGKVLIDL